MLIQRRNLFLLSFFFCLALASIGNASTSGGPQVDPQSLSCNSVFAGKLETQPSVNWHRGQLTFFDLMKVGVLSRAQFPKSNEWRAAVSEYQLKSETLVVELADQAAIELIPFIHVRAFVEGMKVHFLNHFNAEVTDERSEIYFKVGAPRITAIVVYDEVGNVWAGRVDFRQKMVSSISEIYQTYQTVDAIVTGIESGNIDPLDLESWSGAGHYDSNLRPIMMDRNL